MARLFKYLALCLAAQGALAAPAMGMGTAFRVAYSFRGAGDGSLPAAGLTMGPAGQLYGTTQQDGVSGLGTVFRFDPAHETLTVLHRFSAREGALPSGPLAVGPDGLVFGTLGAGGEAGCGAVFALNPATTAYTTLHSFSCGADGGMPVSGVTVDAAGVIYGETFKGGAGENAAGTIFSLAPLTGTITVLHTFNDGPGGDGSGGNPLLLSGGALYGTTCIFDANPGAVFKLSPASGTIQTVHQFAGKDGYCPAALVAGRGGLLFGTTRYGGAMEPAGGVIFQLDPSTGQQTVLHDFNLARGLPALGLTVAADGALIGARARGPFSPVGSTFRLNPETRGYAGLDNLRARRAFQAGDPNAGLVVDGTAVYGTTRTGGTAGKGSIFEIIQ